jgi:L-fuculose-phosphate aldolase
MGTESKAHFDQRATREMSKHLRTPDWSVKQKLALTCQMLAAEGHESGLAGQISGRAEQLGSYWTLRLGLGFDEATEDALIRIDDDLVTLEGEGMPNPATRFHMWVYRARPDVNCIVHTHPPHITALSMVEEPLAVAHMDATPFFDDCAYLGNWPGVPIADEEGRIISEALGNKRAILLAHHGQLVACAGVEEAAVLAVMIERVARAQVLARSIGTIQPIKPELAREAHDFLLKPSVVEATFFYFARRILRSVPDCIAAGWGEER